MDIFAPDIGFEKSNASSVLVNQNIPGTTIGSTNNYVYDANGVARNPQAQGLATSLGQGAVAPFPGGVSLGTSAGALANGCTAVGYHALAKIFSGTALGDQAQSLAYRGIAIGRCAVVTPTGLNGIAIGSLSSVSGANGIAMGNGAVSSGDSSISFGNKVQASGAQSICIGTSSVASGSQDVVIGYLNSVSGFNVIAIGNGIQTAQNNCVLLGKGAIPAAANSFVAGAPGLFQQGPILDVFFGQGPRVFLAGGTVMGSYTIHGEEAGGGATGGANTNLNRAGGNLNLAGGRSTGSGVGGSVNIQVCGSFGSNETLNSLATALSIAPGPMITASSPVTINGPLTINSGVSQCLTISAPAGVGKQIFFDTASSPRWIIGVDALAESGGNAGSNFGLYAFGDTGAFIDNPIFVTRAAGGSITISRPTTVNGSLGVSNGNISITGTGSVDALFILNAGPSHFRYISARTTNAVRWDMVLANSDPETGGNAGSNFDLRSRDDSGTQIDVPLFIARAAGGHIALNRPVDITGNLTVTGTVTGTNIGATSGAYTPAFADAGNSTFAAALVPFKWTRIGNVVHVAGAINFTATVAGAAISFYVTLPIASNLLNQGDLAGQIGFQVAGGGGNQSGGVFADPPSDRARCNGFCNTGSDIIAISFDYIVQ